MAVRNFWIEADIDGRKTTLEGGPRAKDGGFDLTVYVRNHGGIVRALGVYGRTSEDGTLTLSVTPAYDARELLDTVDPPGVLRLTAER